MGLRRLEDRRCYIVRKEGVTQVGSGTDEDTNLIEIRMTATTQMQYKSSATVTSNPVTSGNDAADHITIKNDIISLQGVISDTPMPLSFSAGMSRERYVTELEAIKKGKEVVDVYVHELGGKIKDCIITNSSYVHTSEVGDGLRVSITLKKIMQSAPNKIVSAKTSQDEVATKENGGSKNADTTEVEYSVDSLKRS